MLNRVAQDRHAPVERDASLSQRSPAPGEAREPRRGSGHGIERSSLRLVEPALRAAPGESDCTEARACLLRVLQRRCPPELRNQADDLAQKALLKLVELSQRERRTFNRSFLRRVAQSVLVDEIRRRQMRAEESLETLSEDGWPLDSDTPERDLASKEIAQAIQSCLDALPEHRRAAVALRLRGHSVGEVSRNFGWSGKRTENLTLRGLAELRKNLSALGIRS